MKPRNKKRFAPSAGRAVKDDGERMRRAEDVESRMLLALEGMKSAMKSIAVSSGVSVNGSSDGGDEREDVVVAPPPLIFPSVRECNAALATLGDAGELLRALRLFGKMRKAASLASILNANFVSSGKSSNTSTGTPRTPRFYPPAPTLVTYSTLMSRAVHLGKARVALRLWKLMKTQSEFFTNQPNNGKWPNPQTVSQLPIIPDVKAANILMNAYAKLGDYESALDLMGQMTSENGGCDVPPIAPNLVTWNTLVDACHRADDLSAALDVFDALKSAKVRPDARTYTSLISTVARRSGPRGGAMDPSLAFVLLEEMRDQYRIRPNGMTYCALIDVCGRCGRSDLALKGLRMMLRQKEEEERASQRGGSDHNAEGGNRRRGRSHHQDHYHHQPHALLNEVGAWTAAMDACGKAGRVDTALKLFSVMRSKFGVRPNTVTCGCLTDALLRAGRTAETLDVLRYMKEEGIEPSEVMYTSLMTSAGRMAKMERKDRRHGEGGFGGMNDEDLDAGAAIEVYTELMSSLLHASKSSFNAPKHKKRRVSKQQGQADSNALLLRVFLVFQEMRAAGVQPDLACYNSLLRACSRAGDIDRMADVMKRIVADGLDPNDISWRETIKGAARAGRSDIAERYWDDALSYESRSRNEDYVPWKPNALAFEALADAYMREAALAPSHSEKLQLYAKIVSMYEDVLGGMSEVDIFELHENQRAMLMVLRAAVSLELAHDRNAFDSAEVDTTRSRSTKELATDIVSLESLQQQLSPTFADAKTMKALALAKVWAQHDEDEEPERLSNLAFMK